jgi:hypothetical protein
MNIHVYGVIAIACVFLVIAGLLVAKMAYQLSNLISELYEIPFLSLSTFPFQSGDLILFSSRRTFYDPLHILVTDCAITHVGMVVRNPKNGLLRMWELSFSKNSPRLVRLSNLFGRIQQYQGTVLVRQLKSHSTQTVDEQKLYDIVRKIQEDDMLTPITYRTSFYLNTYDRHNSEFMCFHPPLPLHTTPPTGNKEWICTDILSYTYNAIGVFDGVDYTLWPRDFYSKKEKLPVAAGWTFSKEIRLKQDIELYLKSK